jgi:molybdopterin molybdotransferase
MIEFEKALEIVLNQAGTAGEEMVGLESAVGRVLSRDVFSDIDMPPFDKSAVDGFACRLVDIHPGSELRIIETIPAGSVPLLTVRAGECSRIMTGSMMPPGSDAVIMVEETELLPVETISPLSPTTSRNICYRAENISNGEKVLDKVTYIQPAHFAVLASVGMTSVWVSIQPHIGIISTGNELVEPGRKPNGSKIRNSNAWQLYAQARQLPAGCSYFGIAGDSPGELKVKLSTALAGSDIVILSGGVSMGEFDYVPATISEMGAEIMFKSVAIQPGRPTVFARYKDKFIFGLPGNPVSSFVLFELMVRPFILTIMGCKPDPLTLTLPMGVDYSRKKTSRKTVVPVRIMNGAVYPLEYHGSAHINAYTKANGMMVMDPGQTEIKKGEPADVRPL